ncbi:hypothetical protein MNBD_GAMMA11-2267 [hydrothermal vent metagenome]|uniref:Uncharacterized protein n=1 Tax=hydrothermal vent metagenome TaxID=652676 RepID=A0A3B0XDI3_9ZZZZ
MKYGNIRHMLRTVFVSDFSLPEEMAINIYVDSLSSSGKLEEMKKELLEAFKDKTISWRDILVNDEYEVLDFETEEEAEGYIKRVLWEPIKMV